MKKLLLVSILLVLLSQVFGWDITRQAQFPTNFYALDRVGTTLWAAGYVGGFAKSTDNGLTWNFVPNPAYDPVTPAYKDINDIDFYDELHGVMVSADGLVAVTSDGGITWAASLHTPTIFGTDDVNACVYLPDGKIWVAGWGGKIAYSADHGATWTQQTTGLTDQIYSISMNAAGVGFCALNNGTPDQAKILTTLSYGSTWTVQNLTIAGNPHIHKVRQYGSTVVLAGSLGYVGVSPDNGSTWIHHVNAGGASTNMQDIVMEGSIGYAGGWNGVLLKTVDGGLSFQTVNNDFGLYFEGLNLLPNGDIITAGWNGAIAKSTNQGVNWTNLIPSALDLYSAKVVDENTWYLVGDKGYIIKTADGGQTFTQLHIPANFDIYYSTYFKNAQEGWVSGRTTGKIFHTTDGGANWTAFTVPGVTSTQIYYEFSFPSELVGYVVGSNNIHAKTTDGGATWTMLNGTGLGTSVLYCTYFKTEQIGFAGSSAGQLYVTQDGGLTWTAMTVGSSAQIRDIWFKDANIGVLVNSVGEIYYTSNGGLTATDWTAGTESCLDDMNGVWCDANGIFWAAGYSSDNVTTNIGNSWSIVKSADNGATWTQETFAPLTFNSTRFMGITGATGKLVAYGKNNLIVSADNGGTNPIYATDLFISEYVEGTSYQKALEIFNGTGAPVDLSAYSLKKQTNGVGDFGNELILSGTLAHNDVYVIVNSTTGGTNLAGQPYVDLATTSQVVNFNGNDAVALYHNGVQTDVVGIVNDASIWGADQTWVRNPTVASPTTNFNLADWTVYPVNTFIYLGSHEFTPSGGQTAAAPTFSPAAGLYTAPVSVTLSTTTPGATIYYTLDGNAPTTSSAVYSTPIIVSVTTTIKAMATAVGYNNSSVATAVYSFPVVVPNLAALRSQPADNTTVYTVSGGIVLTFKQTYRNQKFFQDGTAGIQIDDFGGVITSNYNLWDGISNLTGKLTEYGGMLEFVPTLDPGPAGSMGNVLTPEVVTLAQLTANFENYESELVKVMGVTFTGATGSFANGTVYPINDGTADYNFRTTFYDVDYIGQAVPNVPMDLVGIPNSRTDGNYFTSRFAADIQTPQGNVAAPTFSPTPGVYYSPIQVSMSTTTVGASIYYTLDGTTPTAASSPYTQPININENALVKAIAILNSESSAVSTAMYTFPVELANLAALRQQPVGTTIYKIAGEVFLTFKQTYRNQKWVQDSSAGILIDDFSGIVTGTYNVGDGITGICGTLQEFGNQLEFHPTVAFPVASSTGNYPEPQTITMNEFTANFESYESELIRLVPATFNTAETTFANGTVYPLTDGTNTVSFRTTFYDVDYIGTTIPTTPMVIVGIANSRTDGTYITSRNLNDMAVFSLEAPSLLSFEIQNQNDVLLTWAPGEVPTDLTRAWEGLTALKVYRNSAPIATITDFVQYQLATYLDEDLPNGDYNYCVTNVYWGQYESLPSSVVNVNITSNQDEVIIPAEVTALTGNYPNPFNPNTTITYSVKNPSQVNISVYNLKGELVRTLVSESKTNGFYKTTWDGRDSKGNTVTSGVYLYRMQAGNYTSTKRMMLMK
jgi:photosystem II stability/assembly factor-like uncharacterized protein